MWRPGVMLISLALLSVLASHSEGARLNQNLANSISRAIKREVKDEIFTEAEGSLEDHPQEEREAMPLEVEAVPTTTEFTSGLDESTTNNILTSTTNIPTTTTPSPYTYTVTGGSVTPTLPYEGSPTPSPFISPMSYSHSPATAYPVTSVTYPHPPIPTYPPSSSSMFNQPTTVAPIYIPGASPLPHRPSPTPFTLVEDPLPSVHHPARKAQFVDQPVSPTLPPFVPPKLHTLSPEGFSAAANPQPFLSQVHPTPFSFQPLPQALPGSPQALVESAEAPLGPPQHTGLPLSPAQLQTFPTESKPAITFEDEVQDESSNQEQSEEIEETVTVVKDEQEREDGASLEGEKEPEELQSELSSTLPNQESRRPKQLFNNPSPQPIFGEGQVSQQVDPAIQQLQLLQFKPAGQSFAPQQAQAAAPQQFPSQALASPQQFSAQTGAPQQFSQQPTGEAFQQFPSQPLQQFPASPQAPQQQFPSLASQQSPQQQFIATQATPTNPAINPQQVPQSAQFNQQFTQQPQGGQTFPQQTQFQQQFSQQPQLLQQPVQSNQGLPTQFPSKAAAAVEAPAQRFISRPAPQQPEAPQQQELVQQPTFESQPAVPQPITQTGPQPIAQAVSQPIAQAVPQPVPGPVTQLNGQVTSENQPTRFLPRPSADSRVNSGQSVQSRQPQQSFQPQQLEQSFQQPVATIEPLQEQVQGQQFQLQEQQFQPQEQQFQAQAPVAQNQPQASFTAFQPQQFEPEQQQGAQTFRAPVAETQFSTEQQPAQQFQPQQQLAEQFEPQAQLDQSSALFNSINKPATDREPRRQLTDLSKMHHLSKVDALAKLMDIAGSDWDLSVSIQENLVDGGKETDYVCPTPDGHFPDVDNCGVYYQCSGGVANKQKCPAGLKYNVLTNQCDWEASVNCALNKDPRMLTQHAGPSPRPQQSPQNQPFTALQPLQTPIPFNTFFRF